MKNSNYTLSSFLQAEACGINFVQLDESNIKLEEADSELYSLIAS